MTWEKHAVKYASSRGQHGNCNVVGCSHTLAVVKGNGKMQSFARSCSCLVPHPKYCRLFPVRLNETSEEVGNLTVDNLSIMTISKECLVVIGQQAFLYTPPKPRSGQPIILLHLAERGTQTYCKYTDLYLYVALDACILYCENSVSILTSTIVRQRRNAEFVPAVAAILDTLADCEHRSLPYPKGPANERLNHKETCSVATD